MIGTTAYAYYQTHPDMLSDVRSSVASQKLMDQGAELTPDAIAATVAELTDDDVGDSVLPHFIVERLPRGVTGLLIAAIFAAAMSSIDTSLNSSATVILSDLYRRYFRPDAGERESMIVLYSATVVMGAIGTGIAVAMIGVASVLDAWWLLSGIFAGGMLGLFLLGIVSRTASKPAAVTGVIAGLIVIAWMTLPELVEVPAPWRNPMHAYLTIVVGTLTIFFVGLLVTSVRGLLARRRE
jgi:SSS family solute:Na+ symporter